ncbi:MAG: hypothetical protein K8R58_02890 [Bacteroidales bacterium]|nr:hypothetical protein [Bacteroidales bacterium]
MSENIEQKGTARVLRIKVVNLLYLIFFVLAFLYIPADFVDVFRSINKTYEESTKDYETKEYSNLYDYNLIIFDFLNSNNLDNADLKHNFHRINQTATKIIDKFEIYKQNLIQLNGGYNEFNYLMNGKNYNYTEEYLLDNFISDTIKQFITKYKALIKSVVNRKTYSVIDSLLVDDDYLISSTRTNKKWGKYYFSKMPVAGSITIMSKFQNDIRKAENIVLESYIDILKQKEDTINIGVFAKILADTILPKYKSKTKLKRSEDNIYKLGEGIDLAVNLPFADFSKIKAYVKKDDKLDTIRVTPEGRIRYFPYETGKYKFIVYVDSKKIEKEIFVREIKPIVESGKQQIFYTGIDNKIKILHSNFDAKNLKVESDKGELSFNDSVCIIRFKSKGLAEIRVYGLYEKEKKLLSVNKILIKELPEPKAFVNNLQGGIISANTLKLQENLEIKNLFVDNVSYKIRNFNIKRIHHNDKINKIETVKNKSAVFSKSSKKLFAKAVNDDIYIFNDIKVENIDGIIKTIPSIVLTVK